MSGEPDAQIMLDVQDTRVMIGWPVVSVDERKLSWDGLQGSDETWTEEDDSPTRRQAHQEHFASSPPIIPRSPVSQSPMRQPVFTSHSPVQVYEDAEEEEDEGERAAGNCIEGPGDTFIIAQSPSLSASIKASSSSTSSKTPQQSLNMNSSFQTNEDFSDEENEENDPVVHSFGPFGENLLPRFQSISASSPHVSMASPQRSRRPLATAHSPQKRLSPVKEARRPINDSPIKNHVINQLAFSRLHSMPISMIHGQLPKELKSLSTSSSTSTKPSTDSKSDKAEVEEATQQLTSQDLKKIMDDIPCIGEIERKGKDAAGKPLENEFYYLPELDGNLMRREAVTGGMGGTGLRSVRKSHKVCLSRFYLV